MKSFYVLTMSAFALGMTMVPALAGNDYVNNSSEVMVGTMTNSSSNTGVNFADGSYGGNGGNGGDIKSNGDVDKSTTANGGNGGNAGVGGTILSGNALAVTDAYNEVGTNRTVVDRCDCEGDDSERVKVINRSRIMFMDNSGSEANTGANVTLGSYAGDAGDGGDIANQENRPCVYDMGYQGEDSDSDVDESSTGNGGAGGSSSDGGLIQSGDSTSRTTSVNLVGRNITRISR